MYKIGEFSKLGFLTIQALRHYDEMDLLKPARTDSSTGYRYYSGRQLPRVHLIHALKSHGLSLDEIRLVLGPGAGRTGKIKDILEEKRTELAAHVDASRRKLAQMEATLREIEEKGRFPRYPVILKKTEPLKAAALRRVLPSFSGQGVGTMFGELIGFIMSSGAGFAGPTWMAYKDEDYREENADIEVAAPIVKAVPESGGIAILDVPGHARVASVTHQGRYETMGAAYEAVMSWIAENEYHIDGACRELYIVSPADTQDPEKYVSEIQIPVVSSER